MDDSPTEAHRNKSKENAIINAQWGKSEIGQNSFVGIGPILLFKFSKYEVSYLDEPPKRARCRVSLAAFPRKFYNAARKYKGHCVLPPEFLKDMEAAGIKRGGNTNAGL
ncbi:hypothetical protein C8J57DRAFT_1210267 [Mycena rebaudengoi]|nr:hypothetical protein C8J57DRAFT_1210267 [Mycena rebaudengoi]